MNTEKQRATLCLFTAILLGVTGCTEEENVSFAGNPMRGKAAIDSYGCGTCHIIPGITGANGRVGPPLYGIASRAYLGGVVPNTPETMMIWIQNPRGIDPRTAMPNLNVNDGDALDITAYLYTLK